MTSTATPASDITAWVASLPASTKFTRTGPDTTTPTLPVIDGWKLWLWPSGNLWKITGRKGSVGINIDRLTPDQVATFNPNGVRKPITNTQGATS